GLARTAAVPIRNITRSGGAGPSWCSLVSTSRCSRCRTESGAGIAAGYLPSPICNILIALIFSATRIGMVSTRLRWSLLVLAVLLLVAWFGWRAWQGPEVSGYRLEMRPLVQRVVASGEVDSQSLAQVGSEITGVVKARHVREGDSVQAGDLLLELHDDEQQARLREAEAALQQLITSQRPQAQAALREAESNLAQVVRERQRRDELFARQLISAEQREQARQAETSARVARDRTQLAAAAAAPGGSDEQVLQQRLAAARAALARTQIRAQVDGVVQVREVEPGDL